MRGQVGVDHKLLSRSRLSLVHRVAVARFRLHLHQGRYGILSSEGSDGDLLSTLGVGCFVKDVHRPVSGHGFGLDFRQGVRFGWGWKSEMHQTQVQRSYVWTYWDIQFNAFNCKVYTHCKVQFE